MLAKALTDSAERALDSNPIHPSNVVGPVLLGLVFGTPLSKVDNEVDVLSEQVLDAGPAEGAFSDHRSLGLGDDETIGLSRQAPQTAQSVSGSVVYKHQRKNLLSLKAERHHHAKWST
ncbi:MAG TPA: hypothetical protein VLX56_06215 [Nitrososphaerales archaeon]|nr:hypothetical protein [Nitrososphaerales archaeon]